MRNLPRQTIVAFAALLVATAPLAAQTTATQELLTLVPKDFGFCAVVNDLSGHAQRLEQAAWFKALKASPLGQAVLAAPEFKNLAGFESDLKKHLDVDWPTLRDAVLGDAFVFAYRPAAPGQDDEYGLVLVKARQPEMLTRLIDRLNDHQRQAGELKELEARQHQGVTYYRRVHEKNTHFYVQRGAVFAITGREDVLKAVLTGRGEGAPPIHDALRRAGADKALVALWLNPRMFDAELDAKAQQNIGAEGRVLVNLLAYWRALDAIVFAGDVQQHLEARLTLLARTGDLPPAVRKWFEQPPQPSALWQHFPANSVLAIAGRTDFGELFANLADLAPAKERKQLLETVQKTLGAALGLDPLKEGLPNIGPDWGVCVLPAQEKQAFPQALVALAVKPAPKDAPTDQAIYRAVPFVAGLALFEYNRTHDHPIRVRTMQQGSVEIKYLANDQVFPTGFQPAVALKDGYLVLATSPDAVAGFSKRAEAAPAAGADVPFVRFSPVELARLLRQHRAKVVEHSAAKQNISKSAAGQGLDSLAQVLDLFDHVTLSQRVRADQMVWMLRLEMAR